MTVMRPRLAALAFCAMLVAVICGGCKFSGVSAVYMALDSAGDQERTVFYTDSQAVYCVTKFSSAKQDSTVDFVIHQTKAGNGKLHPIFSRDEETPGPGTEAVVTFLIPQTGVQIQVMCVGYCVQNGLGCMNGYADQHADSCGVGATCCYNAFAQSAAPPSVLPYPVGEYTCEVDG